MSKFQNLISSKSTTPKLIQQFVNQYEQTSIEKLIQLLMYAQHILQSQISPPWSKNNVVYSLIHIIKKCYYPSLLIVQQIFLELLQYPARVAARGDLNEIYDYFKNSEYQVQSYHFTTNSLLIFYLLASIKPKKIYRIKQMNSLSKAKKLLNRLIQYRDQKSQTYEKHIYNQSFKVSDLRKVFFTNLNLFNKNCHNYIDFFIQQMQNYITKCQTSLSFIWLKNIAIQDDNYLCSESLFRISQIIVSHSSFNARKRCLQIFSQFLQKGNLLALLLLNFSESFIRLFLELEKMKDRKNSITFFSEIQGQKLQKQLFLSILMSKLNVWALLSNKIQKQYLKNCSSPIYQYYLRYYEKKTQLQPDEQQQIALVQRNLQQQTQYNKLVFSQLQKISISENFSFTLQDPSLQKLSIYYKKHQQIYQYLVSFQYFLLPAQFQKLLEFKQKFPEYITNIKFQSPNKPYFEKLVTNGQQLLSKIDILQEIYYYQISQKTFQTKQLQKEVKKYQMYKIPSSIILSKQSEQLQKKLHLKMNQLASSRSLFLWPVSSLQLNSRPYLAYNLHSKQIKESFVPIVHLNPLRSVKRQKAGISLMEKQQQSMQSFQKSKSYLKTPKFKSLLINQQSGHSSKEHKSRFGLKLTKNKKNYNRYLSYLRKKQDIVHYKYQKMIVLSNSEIKISRSQLILDDDKLFVKYRCECKEKSYLFDYKIKEQPSIQLNSRLYLFSSNICEITIEGRMTKFGYKLPSITFYLQKKFLCEVPLPFAFNNFLKISSQFQNLSCNSFIFSQNGVLDTQRFSSLTKIKEYLRGAELTEDKIRGFVEFRCWQCTFQIRLSNQRFSVKTYSNQKLTNFLFEFLPLFFVRMFCQMAGNDVQL